MDKILSLFAGKALSAEEFKSAAEKADMKLVDLKEGSYVSKDKYDSSDISAKEYKKQIDELTKQMEKAGKDSKDMDTLKAELEILKKESDEKLALRDTELTSFKNTSIAISMLTKAGAKNPKLALKGIDFDPVKAEVKDDSILGFTEKIKAQQETESYLYNVQTTPVTIPGGAKTDSIVYNGLTAAEIKSAGLTVPEGK